MNRNSLLQLLHSPFKITEKDRQKLENLLEKYPFFAAGHMLVAKNADTTKADNADDLLHKAALYASERFLLKALMKANDNDELIEYRTNTAVRTSDKVRKHNAEADVQSDASINASKRKKIAYDNLDEATLKSINADEVGLSVLSELERRAPQGLEADEKIRLQNTIIDEFIHASPSISKLKDEPGTLPDLSKSTTDFDNSLASENLAIILEKQGKYDKAVNIYEQLMLKIPEKKAYFANRIEKIKNT